MVQVCEFCDTTHIGHWTADWSRVCHDYSDPAAIMRAHRPVLQFSMRDLHSQLLTEITYKEMMGRIDPNFLLQGQRAEFPPTGLDSSVYGWRGLRGLKYREFDGDTMVFDVSSSEIELNGMSYLNLIKFLSWDDFGGDPNMTPREKGLRLLWESDIQVHCDDPSFLYWGYQYILSELNPSGAIYQEMRPPVVNNPQQRGIVCKHLNRVLRSLPFYNGDIASAITAQWGGKIDKREMDAIRRRADLTRQANAIPADQVEPEPEPEAEANRSGVAGQIGIPPDLNGGDESEETPNETF